MASDVRTNKEVIMATFLGEDDSVQCIVVINAKGQYSIWPSRRELPPGWSNEGFYGSRSSCLKHISDAWATPTAST
ncbi:MbtH family NRPS accessory protein [Photorhabdus laumondii]|uniref:MbtH family NRPS accessory protein n=1 Tax=Photorhabdus laumondii TaxID=2218628 RepID=UPI00373FCD55